MNKPEEFLHMPIPISMFSAVCALLGGVSAGAVAVSNAKPAPQPTEADVAAKAVADPAQATPAASTGTEAPTSGETDAAGTVFDPARHTGTKVKSGLWRMKTGLARGPGEGEDSPNYVNPNGATPAAASATTGAAASGSAAGAAAGTTSTADDDDEFAAFSAAANANATPAAAKARTWSDADLSKLNNQAAQKLGSADPVKATIAKFVPEGETPHSRNIPADQREAFAQEIEKVAGIEYVG